MVTIVEQSGASDIVSLCAYIEVTPENNRNMIIKNPKIGKPIISDNLAKDRTGSAFVIVEATLADGSTKIIDYSHGQFI